MISNRSLAAVAACVGVLVIACPASALDWPHWRGPSYDGISLEKGFKTTLSEKPKVLWEYPVGSAFSSFTIAGGRLYTCGTKAKQQVLYCFNPDTGEVIWEKPIEKEYKEKQGGDGTRATPTIEDGRVYILGALGRVLCVDAVKGEMVWDRQLQERPWWGCSASVFIEGDLAVVSAGLVDGSLLALDKKTGKEIWKTGNEMAGYATPCPLTFNGRRYIMGFLGQSAIIVEPQTGREVWRTPWTTPFEVNAAAPVFHDGCLFLTSGYDTGCGLFKLSEDGDKLAGKKLWRSKVIVSKYQSYLLNDGALYGSDDKALRCVDFLTGNELWSVPRLPNATVLLANGHLLVLTEKGKLMIAPVSRKEFKPTEAQVLEGHCWTIPLLHNGRLYVRNLEKAVCLDMKAGE